MSADATGPDQSPLAGRSAELTTLKRALDAAGAGRFSAVLISGEPGVGKTRLTEEACNYARGLGFETAAGHCFDNQSRLGYFPFLQAFRQLAKHSSPAAAAEQRRSRKKRPAEVTDIIARLATG